MSGCVSPSTMHAETQAYDTVVREAVHIGRFYDELMWNKEGSTKPLCLTDNKATFFGTVNDGVKHATKHFETKLFFKKELQDKGAIESDHIPGIACLPDALTKQLSGDKMKDFFARAMGEVYCPVRFGDLSSFKNN